MKLISALLQESISGLFTNSIKDFGNDEYEVFAIGYKMLGGEITPGDGFEQGSRENMIDFKFTPSFLSPDYGHFAFDNVSLLNYIKTKLMDTDLRRKMGKEFNIAPVAKDFERQIFIAAGNNAVDIVSRLGRHKMVN